MKITATIKIDRNAENSPGKTWEKFFTEFPDVSYVVWNGSNFKTYSAQAFTDTDKQFSSRSVEYLRICDILSL